MHCICNLCKNLLFSCLIANTDIDINSKESFKNALNELTINNVSHFVHVGRGAWKGEGIVSL